MAGSWTAGAEPGATPAGGGGGGSAAAAAADAGKFEGVNLPNVAQLEAEGRCVQVEQSLIFSRLY